MCKKIKIKQNLFFTSPMLMSCISFCLYPFIIKEKSVCSFIKISIRTTIAEKVGTYLFMRNILSLFSFFY